MQQKITPAIWFNNNASEAAAFYEVVFKDTHVTNESPATVSLKIGNFPLVFINGGPAYKPNPSISFFVEAEDVPELERYYKLLTEGGMVMMPLGEYPWAKQYAFIEDKYGISWQLNLRQEENNKPRVLPCLLFVGQQLGKAQEAISLYTSLFQNSDVLEMSNYGPEPVETAGHVMYSRISLNGYEMIFMDGAGDHKFQFDEGVSLMVVTEDQEETDHFWNGLTKGGKEVQCGWLRDKFGLAWQVVPQRFLELVSSPDKEQVKRVFEAMQPMKKLIIEELEQAAAKN